MIVCLILVALMAAGQAFAQTAYNTGTIYGKVFGQDGQPLPGVTITLESEGMAAKTAFSGDAGSYRFAGLQPSAYAVTFSLQGFTEVRQEDVKLNAGQNISLEITLRQATSEQVVVTGEAPVVDTKKTGASTAFNQDYLKNIPSARDPWVILDQTPGVEVDRINVGGNQSGQQSVFTSKGGSSATNGWSYDGVDITDPAAQGSTPTYYDFDSFEEIQITTGGQDPAIGTGGVVINFVTKRGGNTWAGSASGYFNNDSLQSDNVDADLVKQHFITSNKADANWEFGGDFGGPVAKDKAWAWGAYRYQHISNFTSGLLVHDSTPALNGTISGQALQFIKLTDVNAKLNVAYNTENEGSFQFLYGNKDFDHRFALPPNQQEIGTTWIQHGPSDMFKAEHSWIPSPNWFVDAKYGFMVNKFDLDPVSGIGADAQPVFRLAGDFFLENGYVFYHTKRPQHNISLDANYFKQDWAGGDHEFKFGFAYKHATVTTSCQYGGDAIFYDYAGHRGDVSLGAGVAKMRYLINAQYGLENLGLYAGDTWRMNRLTLNLGFHFDHNTTSSKASDAPENAIAPDLLPALHSPGFSDIPALNNFSPRVGATFDLTGDGKTIVRGNYARFYDQLGPTPANFINVLGACGGCYTGVYTYYADLNGDGSITRNELDLSFLAPFRNMHVGDAEATVSTFGDHRLIDSNLKAQSTDELIAGFERQLMTDVSLSANYTYRKYDNQWASYIPGITSADFTCHPLTVTNPVTGETFTNPTYCDISGEVAARDQYELLVAPGQTRNYSGFEFVFNKRMSNKWMARLNGTIQDQKIHYENNSTSFPGSFQDPTNIGYTNDTWWAQQSTGSGSGGVFTGSRWSFKASAAYQLPYDITLGGYLKVIDGNVVPLIRRVGFQAYSQGAFNVQMAPFDAVRLNTVKYMDLRIDKGLNLGSSGKVNLSLDIFNLFNINTPLRIERRVNVFQFKEPGEIVAPRIIRIGARYTF
jgi:hypothetical protein